MEGRERFVWSVRTRPLAERVIKATMPFVADIVWTEDSDAQKCLDYSHGIDCIAVLKNGQSLTYQVKVLSKSEYHTLTLEGASTFDNKPGDWSTGIAQYQLYIYSADGVSVDRYAMIRTAELHLAQYVRKLRWKKKYQAEAGRSCFYYLHFSELVDKAPETIVYFGGTWQDEEGEDINFLQRRTDVV